MDTARWLIVLFSLVALVTPHIASGDVSPATTPSRTVHRQQDSSTDPEWRVGDKIHIAWVAHTSIQDGCTGDYGLDLMYPANLDALFSGDAVIELTQDNFSSFSAEVKQYAARYNEVDVFHEPPCKFLKGLRYTRNPLVPRWNTRFIRIGKPFFQGGEYLLNIRRQDRVSIFPVFHASTQQIVAGPHYTQTYIPDTAFADVSRQPVTFVDSSLTYLRADAQGDFFLQTTHTCSELPALCRQGYSSLTLSVWKERPASLAILDANFEFTRVDLSDDAITSVVAVTSPADWANLARTSVTRVGAVADGATKLLLRLAPPGPGTVSFNVQDGSPGGRLTQLLTYQPPANVATESIDGKDYAFALYRVPEELAQDERERVITCTTVFTPAGGGAPINSQSTLRLERPPVVLVHGLWSSPETWNPEYTSRLRAAGFTVYAVDYSNTHAAHFAENQRVLLENAGGIETAYREYRDRGMAITRADVVGHSMGGILARELIAWPGYHNRLNFQQGYIRRLVTIGTPHLGSESANALITLRENPYLTAVFGALFNTEVNVPGHGLRQGAVDDLAVLSPALRQLGYSAVPSYALRSDYEDEELPTPDELGVLLRLHIYLMGYAQDRWDELIFQGQPSDGIVSLDSQRGLLATGYNPAPDALVFHAKETRDFMLAYRTVELLSNTREGAGFAPGFPAPHLKRLDLPFAPAISSFRTSATPAYTLTAPAQGAVITPGTPLTVQVAPLPGVTLSDTFIIAGRVPGYLDARRVADAPYHAVFTVPTTFLGVLPIAVVARDSMGNLSVLTRTVVAQTAAPVLVLNAYPRSLSFAEVGRVAQLGVKARYSDAVTREVTFHPNTHYASHNPAVAVVSRSGLVTAVGPGTTFISMTHGARSTVVPVQVELAAPTVLVVIPSRIPRADAGAAAVTAMTIRGLNLTGASAVEVRRNGVVDPDIAVSISQTDSLGLSLMINVTVTNETPSGTRVVIVTTPGGRSVETAGSENTFLVDYDHHTYLPLLRR